MWYGVHVRVAWPVLSSQAQPRLPGQSVWRGMCSAALSLGGHPPVMGGSHHRAHPALQRADLWLHLALGLLMWKEALGQTSCPAALGSGRPPETTPSNKSWSSLWMRPGRQHAGNRRACSRAVATVLNSAAAAIAPAMGGGCGFWNETETNIDESKCAGPTWPEVSGQVSRQHVHQGVTPKPLCPPRMPGPSM